MQKVLTAEQMREVDRLTTERYGIPSILLMENAAHAVARVISEKLGGSVEGKSILVLCGKGNNGGDGAALARILWTQGAFVTVDLFGKVAETKGDARTNFDELKSLTTDLGVTRGNSSLRFREENTSIEDNGFFDWMDQSDYDFSDVLVDALFGTGLSRKLEDFFASQAQSLIGWKRNHDTPLMVAIDIPSGLAANTGEPLGDNIDAHCTVTFTAPKPGNVLAPASHFNGELVIADIGSPQVLVDGQPSQLFVAEKGNAANWLAKSEFTSASYKNKRGHTLIIAGSESYSGAAVLAGNAAMRSGVGLVTIVTPSSSKDSVASRVLPEVMVRGVAETESGSVSEAAFDELQDLLQKADSVAIGSGLSQDESTKRFVQKVIENRRQPMVVDADALNLLSPFAGENHPNAKASPLLRKEGSLLPPLILTPHEGEFLRLLGTTDKDAIKDRVAAVREFSKKHNVILVLKGERVLIGEPGGKVVVNPTGNSGLGKAGNGDTLTGILAGFAAQAVRFDVDIFETVVAAVFVAGTAGDIAAKKYGKRVMTASDVRECLVEVFDSLNHE